MSSTASIITVSQFATSVDKATPAASENTKSFKHGSAPSYVILINTPSPAGIVEPVKLNPITVVALEETVKPLAAASPPLAPVILTLSKPN